MDRLHNLIDRNANRRSLAALLSVAIVLMLCVNVINLPLGVPHIREVSGGGSILDSELFYRAQRAYQVLDSLKPAGRQAYLRFLEVFDFIFPLIYSGALTLLLTVTFRSAFPAGHWVHKWNLVPLGAGAFDYLENISIVTMLVKYPVHQNGVATAAGYFTLAKWVFSGLSLLLIVVGLVRVLWIKAGPRGDHELRGRV